MADSRELANCIRALSIDAVEKANSGHPGMPLGMADAATVLFTRYLKYDAAAPDWPDRDRFVLSNGHGSMLQYSLLYLTGYERMTIEQLKGFRQLGSITPGHPERGETPGIEVTTGPLGQGLAAAVGMACAERLLAAQFGADVVDHRTWVFAGDGCLMEGVGQEAVSLAGHLGLDKLVVVFDDNSITIDGSTELSRSEDIAAKTAACGWEVLDADGHDFASIDAAFARATRASGKPVLIRLRTVIGYGAPTKAGKASSHGAPLGADELAATKKALGWEHPEFAIPDDLLDAWRQAGSRGGEQRGLWRQRLEALPADMREQFDRRMQGELPADLEDKADAKQRAMIAEPAKVATRKASQEALEFFAAQLPELVGGSADLTGSNLTLVAGLEPLTAKSAGRYVYFGVREFAMCAAVNGMAAHGGMIPYGGTFLVFSDYARNALRLAALMRLRSIFVFTHDSIGLGEDGPTHQPVEHLASLRALPGLQVFRPADRVETFECWRLALGSPSAPSALALSRQGLAQLRLDAGDGRNMCALGAYVIHGDSANRALTILATGSEVELAVAAARQLEESGTSVAVVSMPCWELFDQQPEQYRKEVLGAAPRIAVEAASRFGWARYVQSDAHVIGMDGYGVSAPAADAYQACGITVDNVVALARRRLAG